MLTAINVAQYFLSKDPTREVFDKSLVSRNGRTFYSGNARLNKYLHMAQNLHIAKTGEKLFSDDLYAYSNGAVAPSVQENYSILTSRFNVPELSSETAEFLDKVFIVFSGADLDELIAISHEDDEWKRKQSHFSKEDQRMDSLANTDEYRIQYADLLKVMDRM